MRLWHKSLITVLPDKQLLGQWRECCAIASNIANKGTPNHILVNKIMNYNLDHFWSYGKYIANEMERRSFRVDFEKFNQWFPFGGYEFISLEDLFIGWHEDRYLTQCFCNLQEKHDCGALAWHEYEPIYDLYYKLSLERLTRIVVDTLPMVRDHGIPL